MQAIDFYSGVGGWSLGLRFAGIDVTDSFERWRPAIQTNHHNNGHRVHEIDIRALEMSAVPTGADLVVGSPPCTQFSFSNRGGSGDIEDGLLDVRKFLEIIDHIRPKQWVMENVPRAMDIILRELEPGGALGDFAHLRPSGRVFKMEDFGLPQRRRRCLIGCFDFDLLESYAALVPEKGLADVLDAYASSEIFDPIYGMRVAPDRFLDHDPDDFLNSEELRINRSLKLHHPVYNAMAFPDRPDRPVRTLTATCTRVSRESIVVADKHGGFRRLTIRERASLQGFPTTFQFYAPSHGQKVKLIGNALPPLFAYYVGCAAQGRPASQVKPLKEVGRGWREPTVQPPKTVTDRPTFSFKEDRSFRFAIPSLHLKSGVRFELTNRGEAGHRWRVLFKFGSSKDIRSIDLNEQLLGNIRSHFPPVLVTKVDKYVAEVVTRIGDIDVGTLQRVWSHRGPGSTHPFLLLDTLSELGGLLREELSATDAPPGLTHILQIAMGEEWAAIPGIGKLVRNCAAVLAGLVIGSAANIRLELRQGDGAPQEPIGSTASLQIRYARRAEERA